MKGLDERGNRPRRNGQQLARKANYRPRPISRFDLPATFSRPDIPSSIIPNTEKFALACLICCESRARRSLAKKMELWKVSFKFNDDKKREPFPPRGINGKLFVSSSPNGKFEENAVWKTPEIARCLSNACEGKKRFFLNGLVCVRSQKITQTDERKKIEISHVLRCQYRNKEKKGC